MVFAANIMSIFNTSIDFISEGTWALRIFSLAFLSHGAVHILSAFFQGIGKGLPAFIIGASRQLIFLAPFQLIFTYFFGLTGLWLSFPAADAMAMLIAGLWTRSEFRELGIPFSLRSKRAEVETSSD
jgi:Na+-driven multidrug efflux pump